jgi:hypothetical protein
VGAESERVTMSAHLGWWGPSTQAQADARRLRGLYGQEAEAWCAFAMAGLAPGDPRRRSIRRIVKALRAVPCEIAAQQRH